MGFYNNGTSLEKLKDRFSHQSLGRMSPTLAIKHMSAVGALKNPKGIISLLDTKYLEALQYFVLASGIEMVRYPELDIVNFKDGRDFLAEKHETDVVTLHMIPCYGNKTGSFTLHAQLGVSETIAEEINQQNISEASTLAQKLASLVEPSNDTFQDDPRDDYVITMQSPHIKIHDDNAFAMRCAQAGAKIVISFNERVHGFEEDYHTIWNGPALKHVDTVNRVVHRPSTSMPPGIFGSPSQYGVETLQDDSIIMLKKDYLEQILPFLPRDSLIRRIMHYKQDSLLPEFSR